jgi:two-component system response regulator AtoC
MKTSILIVDDETDFLDSAKRMLRIEGFDDITAVADPLEVEAMLADRQFDIAFLDINMPGMDGLDLLKLIKERRPQTECVMVTANESIQLVVKAMRWGAYDYMVKPFTPAQMSTTLERALERRRLLRLLALRSEGVLAKKLKRPEAFSSLVTADKRMVRLLHEAELHAGSDIPILVTGETGVGKELLARAIHDSSRRAKAPFVAVNMLALSATLFESEFFGHAKGAFTGALTHKAGYLARARGGTLFLDEIGDLSLELQGKLLRILQEGEFTPVGKTQPEKADVRFVAATNQDLPKLVEQKKFRKDLFYRLQFAHLRLPPLRSRAEDIPALTQSFLDARAQGITMTPEAVEALQAHAWPGNVRELKGAVEAAVNLADGGDIEPKHLRIPGGPSRPAGTSDVELVPLADIERRHILAVYKELGRNKTRTAKALEIGLQTLHRKLKSYGVK